MSNGWVRGDPLTSLPFGNQITRAQIKAQKKAERAAGGQKGGINDKKADTCDRRVDDKRLTTGDIASCTGVENIRKTGAAAAEADNDVAGFSDVIRKKLPDNLLGCSDENANMFRQDRQRSSPYHVRKHTRFTDGAPNDQTTGACTAMPAAGFGHYPPSPLMNVNTGFVRTQHGAIRVSQNTNTWGQVTSPVPLQRCTGGMVQFTDAYLKNVAQQAIEKVASSGDHVTLDRIQGEIEKTLAVPLTQVAGIQNGRVESIPAINELVRMQCKVNAYIQAFIKVRSVATVFELSECLRDYVSGNRDFKELNLGPLVKQPLVYKFFKMPSDAAVLPLETTDVYQLLRDYLTEHKKWTSQDLSVDELMTYMAEKQNVATPYELGLRISSPALMIGVLKKAQRDCGKTMRTTLERLDSDLQSQLTTIFQQFASGLLTPEGGACVVRQQLYTLDPSRVTDQIFTSYVALLRCLGRVSQRMPQARPMTMKPQLCHAAESFWTELRADALGQQLFKFALCVAQEDAHMQLADLIQWRDVETADTTEKRHVTIPTHDAVVKVVKKYLDRCLANGSLQLCQLELMEQRVVSELHLEHFHETQQGSCLLSFILSDEQTQKYLEECGGNMFTMGTASMSADQPPSYSASSRDILEFVRQCAITDKSQYPLIESALCGHYGVKSAKHLGHGSVAHLNEKQTKRAHETVVFYEGALCAKKRTVTPTKRCVGLLGAQTCDTALACLQRCPLLADFADWSHWRVVFEPELGDLKTFLQKYGSQGGATIGTSLLALETSPGHLLRVSANSTPDAYVSAAVDADVDAACGHLVSIVAVSGGVGMAPLALLANHTMTAILKLQAALLHAVNEHSQNELSEGDSRIARFLLGCLLTVPLVICEVIANQVFLDPLAQVVGGAKSKHLLLAHCNTTAERSRLQFLGLLLGVASWSDNFQERTRPVLVSEQPSDANSTGGARSTVESVSQKIEKNITQKMAEDGGGKSMKESAHIAAGAMECEESSEVDDADDDSSSSSSESVEEEEDEDDDVEIIEDDDVIVVETDSDETADEPDKEEDKKPEQVISAQQAVVEAIRRDEFGVSVALSEDGERLMQKHQERQGRSLRRLAADLYSRDSHFVLELLQNADDNAYPREHILSDCAVPSVPAVCFVVERDRVTVLNNECGFREDNIRAVCDVGRSTKGKHVYGYIGQKGIGFKSVFRVTDRPEIHSNGYHICFDVQSGPMGYILPHWIGDSITQGDDNKWSTRIVLPLKSSLQSECRSLAARFHDVHPSLLLFLHRLKSLEIDNQVENVRTRIYRRDLDDGVVELTHDSMTERWLVIRQMVDTRQMSLQAKSGVQVDSTEIALAFPLLPKERFASGVLPDKQPVFAFLPLRSYGFRFVIQGDFDVPSSREDVDKDCAWNQWLRASISQLFINALDSFRSHADFTPVEATVAFLKFVPAEDEILDFFRPVASSILAQLKARPCLPTQPTEEGDVEWRMPSQLVHTNDPAVKKVITPALLQRQLGLNYLHDEVAALLSSSLAHSLGIQKLSTSHFIDVGTEVAAQLAGEKSGEELTLAVRQVAQWFACIYRSLDEFANNAEHLNRLRALPIMPLQDGRVVSLVQFTVFFLVDEKRTALSENDPQMALHRDLRTLHSALLTSLDGVSNSQVRQLLEMMGVKKLTPRDIIQHHIVPTLEAEDATERPANLLLACMLYLKQQWQASGAICGMDMDRVRSAAVLLTSDGPKRVSQTPIHFTPAYHNTIDLRKQLPGHAWVLISDCYLCGQRTDSHGWRRFLSQLGVLDFIAVTSRSVTLTSEQLDTSPWAVYKSVLPECSTYKLTSDFECSQFVTLASQLPSKQSRQQMSLLLTQLERGWTDTYVRYATTQITDDAGHVLHDVDTSFALALKSFAWLPALEPDGAGGLRQTVSHGSGVFSRQMAVERLLGTLVTYLDAPVPADASLLVFLGVRTKVNAEVVCDKLKSWCSVRDDLEQPMMTTTLVHMKAVYRYLQEELPPKQLQDLFHENAAIFLPSSSITDCNVTGKFVDRSAVRWSDPTRLFNKYENVLLGGATPDGTFRPTLNGVYPELQDVFVASARIQLAPSVDDLCHLLMRIAATSVLPDALSDTLRLTELIGAEIQRNPDVEASVKALIGTAAIIPVKGSRWASATAHPMIADDRELENLFRSKEHVCFVDLGRPIRGGDSSATRESQYCMLHALGVHALTECIHVEPITQMSCPCPELARYVRDLLPYMQKMLYMEHRHVYDTHVASGVMQTLANMRFDQVSKLEMVYSLKHDRNVVEVLSEPCRMIEQSQLCVQREHITSYNAINKELARFFSCGDQPCYDSIRSYLMDVVPLVTSNSPELSGYLACHSELETLPDDVERWQVNVPDVPAYWQAVAPHAAMIVDEQTNEETTQTPMPSGDGATKLRSWPPCSADVPGGTSRRSRGNTVWPPPAPHMSTHQLPVRSSSHARSSQVTDDNIDTQASTDNKTAHNLKHETDDDFTRRTDSVSTHKADGGSARKVDGGSARRVDGGSARGADGSTDRADDGSLTNRTDDSSTCSTNKDGSSDVFDVTGDEGTSDVEIEDDEFKAPSVVLSKKRLRTESNSMDGGGGGAVKKSSSMKFGPPIWLTEPMDSLYDNDLPSLTCPIPPPPEEGASDFTDMVGRWGEQLVWNFLSSLKATGELTEVVWQNEMNEQGFPYDFVVRESANTDVVYVEVKSSVNADKTYFEMSAPQLDFAREKCTSFHVYRVLHAGVPQKTRVLRLRNLARHIENKQVRLCVAL